MHQDIMIEKWDTFSKFTKDLGFIQNTLLKLYIKKNDIDLSKIEMWNYNFSWSYSSSGFVQVALNWPVQSYQKYTVLEWWSIFDIDYDLSRKWFIKEGEYIAYVSDASNIAAAKQKYWFLPQIELKNLEWFLYPDTYNIDVSKDFLQQLLTLQLQNFDTRVRKEYMDQIQNFCSKLTADWFDSLDWYKTLILSTVVEKEERNNNNKPTIAWLFLNRLDNHMRIDADITLCYWLDKPYETCTPAIIAENVSDKNNPYNTRQVGWLPPRPIANPSVATIKSVLNYQKNEYLFYLHGSNWEIHFSETLQWHGQNKRLYLQ